MKSLQGRRAVVTGGTKGTGAAIVALLRSRGAHVTAVARHRPDLEDFADDFISADITTPAGVDTVTDHVRRNGGLRDSRACGGRVRCTGGRVCRAYGR